MERIFLGLGSNAGDSPFILAEALRRLGQDGLASIRGSGLWRSEPRYVLDQPPFLNQVLEGWTGLSPEGLLDLTSSIETELGRDRSRERSKGPRTLDIDLLLYGNLVLESPRLILPHPGIEERKFVLLPLLELDGALASPKTGRSYLASLASLASQGIYRLPPSRYDLLYL